MPRKFGTGDILYRGSGWILAGNCTLEIEEHEKRNPLSGLLFLYSELPISYVYGNTNRAYTCLLYTSVGTVKPNAIDENVVVEPFYRDCDMTPPSVQVRHLEINHSDSLLIA